MDDQRMTVKEIVEAYLKENGYDGLCNYECGCFLDDLSPCDGLSDNCLPGHKVMTPEGPVIKEGKEEQTK